MRLGEGKEREIQDYYSKDSSLGDWVSGKGDAWRLEFMFESLEFDISAGEASGGWSFETPLWSSDQRQVMARAVSVGVDVSPPPA